MNFSLEVGSGQVVQDCEANDEQEVAEVPPPMEPMAPIPVSNTDKMGLHGGGSGSNSQPDGAGNNDSTTPTTSPSLLNKPNDSCDSVDASSVDNVFSSDTIQVNIRVLFFMF